MAAIGLPVVVAVAVLAAVIGGDPGDEGGAPADASATAPARPTDLPVLEVDAPAVPAEAEEPCGELIEAVPFELAGEPARRVSSESPYVYAWGDPATVLVCGVDRPAGFTRDSGLIQIEGVQFHVDTADPDVVVWTAVDRPVYVEVRVPATTDSAGVTQLTVPIGQALERRDLDPAG